MTRFDDVNPSDLRQRETIISPRGPCLETGFQSLVCDFLLLFNPST